MNNSIIIFKKELKDMLRDRRTLFFMILFPMLFIPLLVGGLPKLVGSITEKKMTETLTVAVIGGEYAPELYDLLAAEEGLNIIDWLEPDSIQSAILSDSLDAAVVFGKEFPEKLANMEPADINLYYRSSDDLQAARKRLEKVINSYEKTILHQRYQELNLEATVFEPFNIQRNNIATKKEMIGKMAGGWLPYIFILYCFMGAMYPALDMGAGEKERKTLETILVSPASRVEILMGKFGVVACFGLLSALMGLLGLTVGVGFNTEIPPEIQTVIADIFEMKTVLLILSLVVPVAIFFAAILLSLSIYARTFKEAQSIVAPLNIVIILPALVGIIPGIELTYTTALIPIVNISLAAKEIIAGTIQIPMLLEVYLSLTLLAGISIAFAVMMFQREEVIFRN